MITGATSGIGESLAHLAARRGYRLALCARDAGAIARLTARLGPDVAVGVPCDVTDWAQVEEFLEVAAQRFGQVDAVFANAGVGAARGLSTSDPRPWASLVATNVLGVAYTIRAAVPHVRRARRGHILLMGSVTGRVIASGSIYAATKAAVAALAEALRLELFDLGDRTTRVTLIEAGWVATPLLTGDRPGAMPPGEVADAVLYALDRPAGIGISHISVRPTTQRE